MASFDEAGPFEPMPGRPMREYVTLPEQVCGQGAALHEWLERSFSYATALLSKEKKPRRKRAS